MRQSNNGVQWRDGGLHAVRPIASATALFGAGSAVVLGLAALRDFALARTLGTGATADLVLLSLSVPWSLGVSFASTLDAVVVPSLRRARPSRAETTLRDLELGLMAVFLVLAAVPILFITVPAIRVAQHVQWWRVAISLEAAVLLFVGSALLTFRTRCRLARRLQFLYAGALPALPVAATLLGVVVTAATGRWWTIVLFAAVGSWVAIIIGGPSLALWRPTLAAMTAVLRTTRLYIGRALPVAAGAIAFASTNALARAIAGLGPTGSVSALEYGWRLFNIPTSLLVTSAVTVFLPLAASDNVRHVRFSRLALWSSIVMIPLSFVLGAGAGPVGAFLLAAPADSLAVSQVLTNTIGLSSGLPLMLLANIELRRHQSLQRYDTTLVGSLAFAVASIATSIALATTQRWGLFGFAHTSGLVALLVIVMPQIGTLRSGFLVGGLVTLGILASYSGAWLFGLRQSDIALVGTIASVGGVALGTITRGIARRWTPKGSFSTTTGGQVWH